MMKLEKFFLKILLVMVFILISASSSSSSRGNNLNHMMHLYNGLISHSNSDIILLVDSSAGIKPHVFNEIRNLSEMAVQCLKHVKQSRIAVVTFADRVKVVHTFDQCQTEQCISNSLRSLTLIGGKRATGRALKEAKRMLKKNGRKAVKWTVVLITFGAPKIGRKRTVTLAQRLKRIGVDMFLLAVGKKAFNNYATLKSIARPFERNGSKILQRLFFFRGPQHETDFMMTKAVLNIVCSKANKRDTMSKWKSLG